MALGTIVPYTEALSACTWNAQALFARRNQQHKVKCQHAMHFMTQHDTLALQETHTSTGRTRMFRHGPDIVPFWSHDTSTHTAGVALWVRPQFLQRFSATTPTSWQEIAPGRAAVLRLDGPAGSLDIYTVYMPTGTQQHLRRQLARDIAASLRPAPQVLTLLLGDWNFLADATDAHANATAAWSGQTDNAEATAFADLLGREHRFQELHQSEMTHIRAWLLTPGPSLLEPSPDGPARP